MPRNAIGVKWRWRPAWIGAVELEVHKVENCYRSSLNLWCQPFRVLDRIPASRVPIWQIVNPALSPDEVPQGDAAAPNEGRLPSGFDNPLVRAIIGGRGATSLRRVRGAPGVGLRMRVRSTSSPLEVPIVRTRSMTPRKIVCIPPIERVKQRRVLPIDLMQHPWNA